GVEPAVGVDRLGGGLLVAPVAREHDAALGEQFTVFGDVHARAADRTADCADLDRVGSVDGDAGSGLGEAVTLVDRDADAAEEVAQAGAQRRTAGDGGHTTAAERRAQLAVDELVEHRVL